MNKKILSALLLAAFGFASSSMFVSCKDYDDDIKNLQTQIDGLKATLSEIQTKIQNGVILKSVNPITGGVEITLGNGDHYTITNGKDGVDGTNGTNGTDGKDGKDGTVWTIGDDGYWYKDGAKTDYKAIGKDGVDGTNGTNGNDGNDGKSAYQIAVDNGFKGTEAEWLESLKGQTGQDGESGSSAGTGIYYVPNTETGKFDLYKDGAFVEHTQISFLADPDQTQGGIISAVKTADALTLFGVEGGEGTLKTATINLSGVLKSLVFIPHFYLDGIETIEYPWIGDSTLVVKATAAYTQETHHKKQIKSTESMYNMLPDNLSENPEATTSTRKAIIFGPVIGVDYEINPSNAKLTWDANEPFYNVLEPAVTYTNTRAAAATLNVTSPKTYGRYTEDEDVFAVKSARSTNVHMGAGNSAVSYLQAGLQIAKPNFLEPYPTNDEINGGYLPEDLDASYTKPAWIKWYDWYRKDEGQHKNTDNTIALQLNNIENGSVTSDYALLIPARMRLEGLIWTQNPAYDEPLFGPTATVTGDEKGWYSTDDQIFIWDSPKEALDNKNGAALELPVDDDFIDLKKYIGIRALKENVKTRKISTVDWAADKYTAKKVDKENVAMFYGDEESYDLHYEFELVDYETDTNITHDSRYATFTDTDVAAAEKVYGASADEKEKYVSKTGRVRALTVNEIAQTITEGQHSTTAVDREPLVRILVKNTAGEVLLDGYILIHITNTKANLNITTYEPQTQKFNYCDSVIYQTTWAQFSKLVLQDAMVNYEKQTFDYFYYADCLEGGEVADADLPFVTADALDLPAFNGHKTYSMKIFNFGDDIYGLTGAPEAKGNNDKKLETSNAFEDKALGVVRYYPNADGQTNHRWDWILTADEVEYLTKGKASQTVVRWIRFKAKTFEQANANLADGVTPYTQDNYNAPYPFIWVKLTLTLQRDPKEAKYTKKWNEMWYHFNTGANDGWSGYLLDAEAPRDGFTLKTMHAQGWDGYISNTIETNVPVLTKFDGSAELAKPYKGIYYFAPKSYEITGVSGKKYIITPQRSGKIGTNDADASATPSAADKLYNKLFNRYVVKNQQFIKKNGAADKEQFQAKVVASTESYTWDEAKLQDIFAKYAINPDTTSAGVFANDTLYAYDVKAKTYTPIACIVQQIFGSARSLADNKSAGEIKLFHWLDAQGKGTTTGTLNENDNWVAYDVLNAIGYAANNANIEKQLRAWLGVIGLQCGDKVGYYIEQAQYDGANKATVLASYERPINMPESDPQNALDAKTQENYIYFIDNMNLFDWRGDKPNQGYMYDNHYWFWAYYNVMGVAVQMDPTKIEIKINDETEWKKLSEVTNYLRLRAINTPTSTLSITSGPYKDILNGAQYYGQDLTSYNMESKESALEQFLGVNPADNANKAKFGGLYYENVSGNITKFQVRLTIAVRYEWGWLLNQNFTWKIDTTHGH